jgi:DNA-binding CsgD family transcriptional regulator
MEPLEDVLDRIARGGEAAFAMDGGNRITHWNKACEELLGKPARHVLGKRCQDVMCGRDLNGNVYCHTACPVAYQARERTDDPVRPFELDVPMGRSGSRRRVSITLFAVPSYHPALTAVVHRLKPVSAGPAAARTETPAPPETTASDFQGDAAALTAREREVLWCLARGLSTRAIANELSLAPVTVRNHVQSILPKLGVHSKLEAVVAAHRLGLASPSFVRASGTTGWRWIRRNTPKPGSVGIEEAKMRNRLVPRSEWFRFFEEFSRRHDGRGVTVRVMHPSVGAQVEARDLPLSGIVSRADASGPISLHLGATGATNIEHEILSPIQVWVELSDEGAEEALEVLSEDGTRTILEFGVRGMTEQAAGILSR